MLAKILFELAVKLKEETGVHIAFINLSGGIGIPYRPDQASNNTIAIFYAKADDPNMGQLTMRIIPIDRKSTR